MRPDTDRLGYGFHGLGHAAPLNPHGDERLAAWERELLEAAPKREIESTVYRVSLHRPLSEPVVVGEYSQSAWLAGVKDLVRDLNKANPLPDLTVERLDFIATTTYSTETEDVTV